jgi:hypothetical protein
MSFSTSLPGLTIEEIEVMVTEGSPLFTLITSDGQALCFTLAQYTQLQKKMEFVKQIAAQCAAQPAEEQQSELTSALVQGTLGIGENGEAQELPRVEVVARREQEQRPGVGWTNGVMEHDHGIIRQQVYDFLQDLLDHAWYIRWRTNTAAPDQREGWPGTVTTYTRACDLLAGTRFLREWLQDCPLCENWGVRQYKLLMDTLIYWELKGRSWSLLVPGDLGQEEVPF